MHDWPGAYTTRWFRGLVVALCLSLAWAGIGAEPGKTNLESPPARTVILPAGLGDVQIEPGFRVELVAGENLVNAPAAMAFDENGRLFVAESPRAGAHLGGRIRVLTDTNFDGAFDISSVYADKLSWPSAVAPYGGGLFVGATPGIFFLRDSKSRGFADVRKLSFGAYPATNAPMPLARANSFVWGLDNSIHGVTGYIDGPPVAAPALGTASAAIVGSEFSFDPRAMTLAAVNGVGRSGLSFNNHGRVFFADQSHPLLTEMYEPRYLARNPYFEAPPETLPVLTQTTMMSGTNVFTPPWMVRGNPLVIYRGGAFPPSYVGNAFIADADGQAIRRLICRANGLELNCTPNPAEVDFLTSRDPAFRPVQIIAGPRGALYVATRQAGNDNGRIYRIVPENFRGSGKLVLGNAKVPALVAMFEQPDGWRRDTAARLLYERRDPDAPPLLATMASASKSSQARLQALCALEDCGLLNEDSLVRALRDPDETVREQAVRLAEKIAAHGLVSDKVWQQLRALAADPSLKVRYQLAFTVGNIARADRLAVLLTILRKDPANPWVQTAVLSSLAYGAGDFYVAMANDPALAGTPTGADFLHRLLLMIGNQGRLASLARIFDWINTMPSGSLRAYGLLHDLGEGLRRGNSSLSLADPDGRMERFYAEAFRIAVGSGAAEQPRIAALRLLGVSPYTFGRSGDLILLLLGSGQSPEVQMAAVETLGRFSDPRVSRAIIQRWRTLPASVRPAAVTALLSRRERVPDVVAALEQGTIARTDLTQLQINYLRTIGDPGISARVARIFGPLTWGQPQAMKRFAPALQLTGSAARGRDVYRARCAVCHDRGGEGSGLGPDLQKVRTWTKDKILGAILEPNADIPPDYAATVADTVVGDTYIGILTGGNDTIVTLRLVNGESIVLPRVNVQTLQTQPWSLMPDNLVNDLTNQNLADLLEYVTRISQ